MSILGNLFSNDGGSESSSDFLGVLNVTGDIGVDIVSKSSDEDGEESWDHTHIGTDFDLGAMLGSAFDGSSDSDSDGGGLLGIL